MADCAVPEQALAPGPVLGEIATRVLDHGIESEIDVGGFVDFFYGQEGAVEQFLANGAVGTGARENQPNRNGGAVRIVADFPNPGHVSDPQKTKKARDSS